MKRVRFSKAKVDLMAENHFVFLHPDCMKERYLYVIIAAETRVVYASQVGEEAGEIGELEGFLIPLSQHSISGQLMDFFSREFPGQAYQITWTEGKIASLKALVMEISCWYTVKDGSDDCFHLLLDETRMEECTKGWIPVHTPYGYGVLVFNHRD